MELKKIIPYLPAWAKPGCITIRVWEEEVKSGHARGTGTFVQYVDKKGKEQECMKWVKWDGY